MQTKHKRKKASHAKEEAQKILVFKIKLALIKKSRDYIFCLSTAIYMGLKKEEEKHIYIYISEKLL